VSVVPRVSVVVPTHNRAGRLATSLNAVARQDYPPDALEVIVVADGCTDDTAGAFAAWRPPFAARLIQQAASGPAAARNRGAAAARGRYLVFLDDDVEASPGLVGAHLEAHGGEGGQVVIGYLPARVGGTDFFSIALRGWWDAMFQAMWTPGHRFTFRDLLSGNFSLERGLLEAVGGFETGLRCHEDYELGLRLIEAGARFRFAPQAVGFHDDRSDLAGALRRKFEEGRADLWMLARRPQLFAALPLKYIHWGTSKRRRLLCRLAVMSPRAGDGLARAFGYLLGLYERLRLRFRWRALLEDLLVYWYWRGLIAGGGPPDVDAMRRRGADAARIPADAVADVDLAAGLEAAEHRLGRDRPVAVRLRYGPHPVGDVPAEPGAEPLRGEHLRPLLADPLLDGYLRALALAGELPPVIDAARVLAECHTPRTAAAATGQAQFAT
jgi:glycosyltransferase involved in cell wall biosynthesis